MIMKLIHRISAVLIVIVMLLVAGSIVVLGRTGESWQSLVYFFENGRLLLMFAGFGTFFLCGIYVLSLMPAKTVQKYLSFDGENGTVSISTAAIAEYVGRIAGEFPSIVKMKPEVIPVRNNIDINAHLQIKDGPDIHDVCELLQKRIREVLAGSLGITGVRRIQVSVKEIIPEFNPD